MEVNLYSILYTIMIGILGYFTRDIYNYVKRKYIRGNMPKVVATYSWRPVSASGTFPRRYRFESTLRIRNIDTEPIYNLTAVQELGDDLGELVTEDLLEPTATVEKRNTVVVEFGDTGTDYEGAESELSGDFKQPRIVIRFEDKEGHSFKKGIQEVNPR